MRLKDFSFTGKFNAGKGNSILLLAFILLLGLGLRFWNLDAKPLWLDEVLTALFTMGKSATDVPLNQFFPLADLDQIFSFRSGVSCPQLTQTLIRESVHPPLFFCLIYRWLSWLQPNSANDSWNWVWAIRSLPALLGVGTIAALYWLNRVAFSPAAARWGAALMAVSPFAVYLSQEARHYTLPMLLITLALVMLVKIQQSPRQFTPWLWIGWTAVNLTGLYVHYFCLLALIAQIGTIALWMFWQRREILRRHWVGLGLAILALTAGYLPWIPIFLSHMSRPETDWLIPYKPDWIDRVAPLYQTVVGWLLMVIALPIEEQPDSIVYLFGSIGLVFALWLGWQIFKAVRFQWGNPAMHPPLLLLSGFVGLVLLQFFAIVYLLDKDLTVVPRYNFVYYPAMAALLGAVLVNNEGRASKTQTSKDQKIPNRSTPVVLLMIGFLSSVLVVNGVAFQKSYRPNVVAQDMAFEPNKSLATVVSYRSPQEIALGLSFALELRRQLHEQFSPEQINDRVRYAFVDRTDGYGAVWRELPQLDQPLPMPLNLWVIASPGMRTRNYPSRVRLSNPATPNRKAICPVDPEEFHRVSFPYQLFRCESRSP
ncbi:glycosyltransferase family 39 protein [Leptolyngbya ohadii]|uniref:glycosyltransferase family 39 protein n=1 Tax=Leptolyngbya ohadii TaxID=1962290 RepID=UPI000B59881A|nr:glycosyltransferase family 39 protein [Leptolyngbya ohadii]